MQVIIHYSIILKSEHFLTMRITTQYNASSDVASSLVSCPCSLSCTRREGVWTNVYRTRVAHTAYSAHQSDAWIKSHDCVGMNGMHSKEVSHTQWNAILFAFLIQKYVTSCIPRRHVPYTRLSRPLLSACVKGSWARDYLVLRPSNGSEREVSLVQMNNLIHIILLNIMGSYFLV